MSCLRMQKKMLSSLYNNRSGLLVHKIGGSAFKAGPFYEGICTLNFLGLEFIIGGM